MALVIGLVSHSGSDAQEVLWPTYVDQKGRVVDLRTDTLIPGHFDLGNILVGTCVLRGTMNSSTAVGYGYWLSSVAFSECRHGMDSEEPKPDEITDIAIGDSTLTIGSKIYSTCGHDFLCDIQMVEDTILNLVNLGYGSNAICWCCFGLTYNVEINKEMVEKPLRYAMMNSDRRSLKRIRK